MQTQRQCVLLCKCMCLMSLIMEHKKHLSNPCNSHNKHPSGSEPIAWDNLCNACVGAQ